MSSFIQYFPSAYFVGGVGGAEVKESALVRGRILAEPEEVQDGMMCGQSRGCPRPQKALATIHLLVRNRGTAIFMTK